MRAKSILLNLALVAGVIAQACLAHSIEPSRRPALSNARDLKAAPVTKPMVLGRLKELQKKQTQAIENAANSMRKIIQESQNIKINDGESIVAERQLQTSVKRLAALREQKEEATLRYEFIEQLIFQFDSKWTNQPIAVFFEQQLLDMAVTDAASAGQNKTDLWRFYTLLSVAIREIPEPREDIISFLDGYMEFSTIKNPKSPVQYLSSRHYTNGAVNEVAKHTDRDQLSAGIDKQLKDLEGIGIKSTEPTPSQADIEMRTKVPAQQ